MKKICAIFLLIMFILNIFSCQKTQDDIENDHSDEHSTQLTEEDIRKEYTKDKYHLESTLIDGTEGYTLGFNVLPSEKFKAIEYVDENAEQSMTINVLGETYSFVYEKSALSPIIHLDVDVYSWTEYKDTKILVDRSTKKIIR